METALENSCIITSYFDIYPTKIGGHADQQAVGIRECCKDCLFSYIEQYRNTVLTHRNMSQSNPVILVEKAKRPFQNPVIVQSFPRSQTKQAFLAFAFYIITLTWDREPILLARLGEKQDSGNMSLRVLET